LAGQLLRARHVYRRYGRRWLVLELPDGGTTSVEVGDTDVLDAGPVVRGPNGTTVLSREGARRLLGLLDACRERMALDGGGGRRAGGGRNHA
jgi:hypothetical protein